MKQQKLAGDLVEEWAKAIGVQQVVRHIEHLTKRECGCAQRKEWLNQLHHKILNFPRSTSL